MSNLERSVEQDARDRLPAVALARAGGAGRRRTSVVRGPAGTSHDAGPLPTVHRSALAADHLPAADLAGELAESQEPGAPGAEVGLDPDGVARGPDPTGRDARRGDAPSTHRTALLGVRAGRAEPARDEVAWLPEAPSPAGDDRPVDPARAADVRDVAARDRAEALAAAAASYTRSYGHPLDHPGEEDLTSPRRWWLSTRHAVVAGIAVLVLATGIVLRTVGDIPGAAVPVVVAESGPGRSPAGPADGGGPVDGAAGAPGPGSPQGIVGPGGVMPGGPRAPDAGAAAPGVVVHVVGRVGAPGVLALPTGSRVSDAVTAAGGPAPDADLSAVNLARVLVDGEQVHVPAHGEAPRAAPPPAGGGGATAGVGAAGAGTPSGSPVALNTADLATLDALPGIGPVLAQRILDWRAAHGPFRTVEELGEVDGIGEALLTRLRPLVQV